MDQSHPANYRPSGIEQSRLSSHSIPVGPHQFPHFSFQNFSHPSTASINSTQISCQGGKNQPDSSTYGKSSQDEAALVASRLRQMSTDDVERLLNNKKAYEDFFKSLGLVRGRQLQNELVEESIQLARRMLEKEPQVLELKNQCMIIRTTELVAAQEKLNELERQKEEILNCYSLESLLQMLEDAAEKISSKSEGLCEQAIGKEIELSTFIQNYKGLRNHYHRYSSIHLAAKTHL